MATLTEAELRNKWNTAFLSILGLGKQILSLQQQQDEARADLFSADYQLRAVGVDPVGLLEEVQSVDTNLAETKP